MMDTNKKITIQLFSPVTVILFILFFLAKIFDKIDWSWWWVFSPLWIPASILIGIIGVCLLLIGITKAIDLCLR